jgi:hypothetical protein
MISPPSAIRARSPLPNRVRTGQLAGAVGWIAPPESARIGPYHIRGAAAPQGGGRAQRTQRGTAMTDRGSSRRGQVSPGLSRRSSSYTRHQECGLRRIEVADPVRKPMDAHTADRDPDPPPGDGAPGAGGCPAAAREGTPPRLILSQDAQKILQRQLEAHDKAWDTGSNPDLEPELERSVCRQVVAGRRNASRSNRPRSGASLISVVAGPRNHL